jgi:hypothetical protein
VVYGIPEREVCKKFFACGGEALCRKIAFLGGVHGVYLDRCMLT